MGLDDLRRNQVLNTSMHVLSEPAVAAERLSSDQEVASIMDQTDVADIVSGAVKHRRLARSDTAATLATAGMAGKASMSEPAAAIQAAGDVEASAAGVAAAVAEAAAAGDVEEETMPDGLHELRASFWSLLALLRQQHDLARVGKQVIEFMHVSKAGGTSMCNAAGKNKCR